MAISNQHTALVSVTPTQRTIRMRSVGQLIYQDTMEQYNP